MADDAKLQLGIDMEALQRSASQATSMLSKAFAGIGPSSLLGSGVAPSQGPSTQQGGKDTIRGVIDALERVDRTLVIGFNALAGGVYLGGRAGGGEIGIGKPKPPPEPPKPLPQRRSYGVGQAVAAAGDIVSALMPSAMNMTMGGFYGTDVMGFLHNAVSQIPIAGRLLGAITGPFHQAMQKEDEYKNIQYEMFRDVGKGGMEAFSDLWETDDLRKRFINRYGFSRSETQQLISGSYRRGVGSGSGLERVLDIQGQLGLGQEASEMIGGLHRAGMKPGQETDVLANAIGVAVATGLERGRWGEMLTMWQRAAQSSVDTDIAWREVAAQQQFVGSLGERFKGDTAAAQSMDQALRQMASTKSPLALRAAMQLTGGDYFAATSRMARAAQTPDTQLEEANINQLMGLSIIRQYMSTPDGPDADVMLKHASGIGAIYFPTLGQLKIEELLKAKKRMQGGPLFKPPSAAAVEVGRRQVTGGAPLPEDQLAPRRAEAEKQRPTNASEIFAPIGSALRQIGRGGLTVPEESKPRLTTPQEEFRRLEGDQRISRPIVTPIVTSNVKGAGTAATTSDYRQFVMQDFGNRISGRSAPHPGVDLAFPPGTSVTCPVDGIVTEIHPSGTGLQVGTGIHIRDDSGEVWKLYHLDPETVPQGLQVGQRIAKGAFLGRTYSVRNWLGSGVRTHLHVGQVSPSGRLLNPMRPGGIEPGSLTGGELVSSDVAANASATPITQSTSARGSQIRAGQPQRIETDVHVYIHQDAFGRPIVRTRGTGPTSSGPPATMSLDFDKLMK